jgi:hypothetical protein
VLVDEYGVPVPCTFTCPTLRSVPAPPPRLHPRHPPPSLLQNLIDAELRPAVENMIKDLKYLTRMKELEAQLESESGVQEKVSFFFFFFYLQYSILPLYLFLYLHLYLYSYL